MNPENKEFYDLLETLSNEQTYEVSLAPRKNQDNELISFSSRCKPLTTAQLKSLVRTVVDSPVTQAAFNSAATKIYKSSICNASDIPNDLNSIDRLLFIIKTRIENISPGGSFKEDDKQITVDFNKLYNDLLAFFNDNAQLILPSTATDGKITIEYGVSLLESEEKLNEEIYKDVNPKIENIEELRKLIGEAFIHEIAKSITSVSIGEKKLNFSKLDFKSRIKTVESLPASLIQNVISYVESYKKPIDSILTIDGVTLSIDGSLFSSR